MGNDHQKLKSKPLKRARDENGNEISMSKKSKNDAEPLKLDDLNDDCLCSIFAYLDVKDLVNVAETNSCFIPSAQSVFSQQYRNKKFVLSTFMIGNSAYNTIDKTFAVPFFHHFGEYVSDLLVDCLTQHDQQVEAAILTHCAASLVSLDLVYTTTNCFKAISKPFQNIEKLTIVRSMLSQKLSDVNAWFPNLTSLEMLNIKLVDPTCIEHHFHSLKELMIHNEKNTLPQSSIITMLRLNPQVEKMRWRQMEYDSSLLRAISEHLPLLEELELWAPEDRFLSFVSDKIAFENVKKFTLNSFYQRAEFVECVPFHFKKLETLILDGFNEYQDHLVEFVMQNKDLTKLSLGLFFSAVYWFFSAVYWFCFLVPYIGDFDDLTIDDIGTILAALPKLAELEFCADLFSKEEIVPLLNDNKMLEKVRLLFTQLPLCPHLRAELKTEWNLVIYSVLECIEEHELHYCFDLERKH